MFTENYYTCLRDLFYPFNTSNELQVRTVDGTWQNLAGIGTGEPLSLFSNGYANEKNLKPTFSSLASTTNCMLGDGTTAPTRADYTLSGKQITGLTLSSCATETTTSEDGTTTATITWVLENTTDADVTVSEIGTFKNIKRASGLWCMIDRTLLDEPVTIAAGNVGKIVYKLKLTLPVETEE